MASVNTHEMLTDAVIYLQKNTYSSDLYLPTNSLSNSMPFSVEIPRR